MSFELLDFINKLIVEETLSLPPQTLAEEVDPQKLPSGKRVRRFRTIAESAITGQQTERLTTARTAFALHQQKESLYEQALRNLPQSIDDIFSQIVSVVTSGKDTLPNSWTLAHREESAGKDHDEELQRIWVRMHMLGFVPGQIGDSK